jgi:hypothetical protein
VNKNIKNLVLVAGFAGAALLTGCATSIKASGTQNPPPKEAFSAYGRIEVRPVVFKAGYEGDAAGLAKIDSNFREEIDPALAKWNQRPDNGRKLVIEPVVDELSFKHGAKRVLLGPLAGSSGVLMHVSIHDANGAMVANPEFFQRAAAMAAGFQFGVHDNMMLTRVGKLAGGYVLANFDKPVGGPTGADDKAVAEK